MRFSQKIAWALLGIAALGGIAYWDTQTTKREEEQKKAAEKALDFETEQVREVVLKTETQQFRFRRDKVTTPWAMVEPALGVKPDADAIQNFLSGLQTLRRERNLPETEAAWAAGGEALKPFGLLEPVAHVTLECESPTGQRQQKHLWVGSELKVGSASGGQFMAVSVYARNDSQKSIFVVDSSVNQLVKKQFSDFRSRAVADFVAADVTALTIAPKGASHVKLVRSQKGWQAVGFPAVAIDGNAVSLYLDKLSKAKANQVVEKSQIKPNDLSQWGLLPPAAVVTLFGKDEKPIQSFLWGLDAKNTYVKRDDAGGEGSVGLLDLSAWADFVPAGVRTFRDKRVMRNLSMSDILRMELGGSPVQATPSHVSQKILQKEGERWYAVDATPAPGPVADPSSSKSPKPVVPAPAGADTPGATDFQAEWEFMTAEEVLDPEAGGDVTAFGLNKPVAQVKFEFTEGKGQPVVVQAGNRVPGQEKKIYVKRSDLPEVFAVDAAWLDKYTKLLSKAQP